MFMKKLKPHLIVLTGAGVSAESGIPTFRDANGLWEGHRFEDVATPEAWQKDPKTVLRFYNERRRAVRQAQPNLAHKIIAEQENNFRITIITQNIDNLHEKAGSSNVVHLHGEILKSRSTKNESLVYNIEGDNIDYGEQCELGSQLRPHIVWFGEAVPEIERAAEITATADYLMIVGTSLQVYPAAGLINYAPADCPILVVDPKSPQIAYLPNVKVIPKMATEGVPEAFAYIKNTYL